MNVKELINELKQYPKDLMVVISGYEGGVNEVISISKVKVALNQNEKWYYGDHEVISEDNEKWDIEAVWI